MSVRYNRQSSIKGWDQSKIEEASVVIIGAGALGNHVAPALSALGFGTIKIVDFDNLEVHNLNRQFMFIEDDVGKNKAEALADRISERNSSIIITPMMDKIDEDNIDAIIGDPTLIIDCVDKIFVRRIVCRYALEKNIPMIHGGISWNGWQASVITRNTPCINCIYPQSLQDAEKTAITSCTAKAENSVVYTGQMCGAFMANLARKIVMPLPDDTPCEGFIYRYNEQMENPMYVQKMDRKIDCPDCMHIIKELDNPLYKKIMIEEKKRKKADSEALAKIF